MLATAWTVALAGLDGVLIEVEVAVTNGLPKTELVGLPDTGLHEAKARCRAALKESGHDWPDKAVTINLRPSDLPKTGSHYDLAIMAAVMGAAGIAPVDRMDRLVLLGGIGLTGRVHKVRGILPAVLAAQRRGRELVVVPHEQVAEAALVDGMAVQGVGDLNDLIAVLRGRAEEVSEPKPVTARERRRDLATLDMADVTGQLEARWAVEVAAAGRHHLMMKGPPGVGKTMLAERLPGLLPDLTMPEALEVAALRSLRGLPIDGDVVLRPPYSDPHHSASMASLVGGGRREILPGAISMAHRGVLFLDESPEFARPVLEALRTPLESGMVSIDRVAAQGRYPARFQLVMAANPCPCGNAGTASGPECRCTPMAVRRYGEKISGPVLDRIDIAVHLRPLRRTLLAAAAGRGESSAVIADRVLLARDRQRRRLEGTGWLTNAEVAGSYLRGALPLPDGVETLDRAVERGRLTSRGVDRCLRLAWTLADLAGLDRPGPAQVHQALALRGVEQTEPKVA